MIKTRLVRLLSHTKKYIMQMVLWQWIALLLQIVAIFCNLFYWNNGRSDPFTKDHSK